MVGAGRGDWGICSGGGKEDRVLDGVAGDRAGWVGVPLGIGRRPGEKGSLHLPYMGIRDVPRMSRGKEVSDQLAAYQDSLGPFKNAPPPLAPALRFAPFPPPSPTAVTLFSTSSFTASTSRSLRLI
ncbi:hypothetical protein PHLCEN_2v7735 [Hermanssonia centrifuga]|uniref:Uncharacterized protein n=1 Tax=Hermanssonia centrifuga TaxID=98765 RepID=A0A2R6NVV0_9APHY|nr:hypothetical protein PHLCEN_2v7735 [Hermanssonia centrifuga]